MRRRALPALLLLLALGAAAEERFPPPDFSAGGYQLPQATRPDPPARIQIPFDALILLGGLAASSYLVLKRRSRRGVYILSLAALAYFGFVRQGCVCPIGSIQNVSQALFDPGSPVSLGILVFFLLPLLFTLFFGRTYCTAVCPHGALQDLALIRPRTVPFWLDQTLGLIPYLYLGLAVICAATGSAYLICEYDPFVPLFRLSGSLSLLVFGGLLLLLGTTVGRPYCRYLCPYGALLRLCSRLSRWRVRIYPDRCTNCRLCDASCPYGALRTQELPDPSRPRARGKLALSGLLIGLPFLVLGGAGLGQRLAAPLSVLNASVRLEQIAERGAAAGNPDEEDALRAFQQTGRSNEELHAGAQSIRAQFDHLGVWFGAWVGLVLGIKLLALSMRRHRTEYEADRAACLACARCFEYCPGGTGALPPATAPGGSA